MGDIANANRTEQLAARTKKDLKFVQLAEQSNLRVPQFHYETKPFTIVQWVSKFDRILILSFELKSFTIFAQM